MIVEIRTVETGALELIAYVGGADDAVGVDDVAHGRAGVARTGAVAEIGQQSRFSVRVVEGDVAGGESVVEEEVEPGVGPELVRVVVGPGDEGFGVVGREVEIVEAFDEALDAVGSEGVLEERAALVEMIGGIGFGSAIVVYRP